MDVVSISVSVEFKLLTVSTITAAMHAANTRLAIILFFFCLSFVAEILDVFK